MTTKITKFFISPVLAVMCLLSFVNISFAQPTAPINVSVGTITTSSVQLNWTGTGGNDSYIVAWFWGATAPTTIFNGVGYHLINDASAETYTVTGIQAGQQMSFTVFSRASGILSQPTAQVTVSTLPINTTTFTNSQPYSLIIGQRYPEGDCGGNDGGVSAHSIGFAQDVFSLTNPDGTDGKYFVADTYNHRVLIWNTKPTSNNQDADVVLGQPNFTTANAGYGANQFNAPTGVCSDGTRLFVVDQGNNRVLVWNTIPTTNQTAANIVLGQSNFGAAFVAPNNGGRSASRMNLTGVFLHGNGICVSTFAFQTKLIICDSGNDRVLIYNDVSGLYTGAPANHVIGQSNFTGQTSPTQGGNNSTAATLLDPVDVDVTSDGKLIVLSGREHRALIFNSIPTSNGASANNVLGQTNFSNNSPSPSNNASSFYFPTTLAISKFTGKLALASSGSRVVIWNTFPTNNYAPADNILGGYTDLNADVPTQFSNQGGDGFSAATIRYCYGMSWTEDGGLSIADGSRNSIVKFNGGDDVLHSPTSVSTGAVTNSSVELNWSGGAADRYYIYYRYGTTPPVSATDPLIANSQSPAVAMGNSYLWEDLPCGTQFSFAVFAEKNSVYAPVSGTVNAVTTSSSCVNYPLLGDGFSLRQMITSITGDTIFAAGGFHNLYSKTGTLYNKRGVFAMNAVTGDVLDWTCNTDGEVTGVVLDKVTGSLYIGGGFNNVNGTERRYVAKINQDGSVNTGFTPPALNGTIGGGGGTCMTLNKTGDTLFFWGQFTSVTDLDNNTFSRFNVCALVTADGSLSSFNTDEAYLSNATCRFFTLSPDGRSIFCGSNSGGMHLRSFSLATGESNFDFGVDGGLVACGWYDGSKYMYFGGGFAQFMGNTDVRRLAKVDMSGAMPVLVETFNNSSATYPNTTVRSMKGNSTTLYLEGDFSNIGGTGRHRLAALSSADASLYSWDPDLSNNYSNGTAGNLFVHQKYGKLFYSMVNNPNNTGLMAEDIPIAPSSMNGSASGTLGASASMNFSNEGGIFARLTTGTSALGATTVSISGAGGDTMSINGYTVMERMLTVTPATQPTDNVTVHFYVPKSEMDFFSSLRAGFGNAGNNYSGCKVHRLGTMNEYVQTFTPTITINGEIVDIAFDTPGFSSFVMSDDGVLPVELSSFTSFVNKNSVTLNWRTVTETNNAGFDVERKKDGEQNWVKTGTITGAGNSTIENSYSFEDRNVLTGKYSYRLKQIDFNGNYEYHNLSGFVSVGVPVKYDLSQNYPNPFNPTTKINYDLAKDGFVKINVYDITGRLISTLVETKQTAGYYTVSFNAASLSSGMYFYRIESESFIMTKKMVLVK